MLQENETKITPSQHWILKKAFVFSAVALTSQFLAHAQHPFLTAVGAVEDFAAVAGLVGDTQVFPAAAIHEWRNDYYGYYRDIYFEVHMKVERDPYFGVLKFTRKVKNADGTVTTSNEPFMVSAIRRRSFRCDRSIVDANGKQVKYIFNELEGFSICVTHASSPVKTGMFPPGPPYPIVVESAANKLDRNCTPVAPFSPLIRTTAYLNSSGFVVVKFPWMDFDYAWPPALFKDEK